MSLLDTISNDLDTFIDDDDFAVEVSYSHAGGDASTINVIWDEAGEFRDMETGEVLLTPITIWAKTSDVSSVAVNDTVVKDSTTYYVHTFKHDGTGITVLALSESQVS